MKEKLDFLKENNLYRDLKKIKQLGNMYVELNGKKFLSFSSNDYLGLSQNQQVKNFAIDALKKYGIGSGSSRLVSGNHDLYEKLEGLLARINYQQNAVVMGSGYLTNIGVLTALLNKDDLIIVDKLSHACLIDGAKLSGAKLLRFKHNDVNSCLNYLKKHRSKYNKCIIVTESIFSMDGDVAPLEKLYTLAEKYNSWLLVDNAHAIDFNINYPAHIKVGTLSKAIGSYGGYVCSDKITIDYIKNHARSFIFSTSLPPVVIAAAIKSIEIVENKKCLAKTALDNAKLFTKSLNLKEAESQIVPLIIGSEESAIYLSEYLLKKGFYVTAIRPPTVPKDTSRLRFTFSSLHKPCDIVKLADSIINSGVLWQK